MSDSTAPRSSSMKSPGPLTSVMRVAAPPRTPRVLRAAIVRGGKVIEERVLPAGAALTVGPSEHNTFVSVDWPSSVRLVEHTSEGYRLRITAGMKGRVAKGAAIHDVTTIGGDGTLSLGDDARGRLVLGDTVVLFHFVDPPAPRAKAALPIGVRKGTFGDLDWKTTTIAAFSFLFHFAAVGAIYSDWADPVTDDAVLIACTLDGLKALPLAPPLEQPSPEPVADASSKATDAAPSPAHPAPGRSVAPSPAAHGGPPSGVRMSDSRARDLARELGSLNDTMLQVLGAHNQGATGRVLAAGNDMPLGMLEKAAAGAGGTRAGDGSGLNLRGDGGVVQPGAAARGGLLGGDGRADARAGESGKMAEVKKPVGGKASIDAPSVNGNVPDAGKVVAGLRGPLRACYKHALDEDPNMRGSARVTVSIAPNGEVKSAQAAGNGLSSSMISCVTRVVRGAQFSPPEGGFATLVIPMSFLPQ